MKRLVLRIAALVTVVVLGLIAIAQAQRGSEDTPPVADELVPTGSLHSGEGPSGFAPVDTANQLRETYSSGTDGNPFRRQGRPAPPLQADPTSNVLLAGHQEGVATVSSPPAGLPEVGQPAELPRFQAGYGDPAGGSHVGQMAPGGGGPAVASPPENLPPRLVSQGAQDTAVGGPLAAAEPRIGASMAADEAEPPGGFADRGLEAEPREFGEPARLQGYQLAAPAPLAAPDMTVPADGRFPNAPELVPPGAAAGQGTGQPGNSQLEGPQSPQLTIQKSAPSAIQVGTAATFRIIVRNTGSVAAHEVEVRDQVPRGARFLSSTPRASRGVAGDLVWPLGTLRPGEESTVEIQLEPIAEGEIGSVATVRFQAEASARSLVTKPELLVQASAPSQVLSGEEVTLSIEVSNPGSGVATGVVLEEHIPAGLRHPAGPDLEYNVGDLPPGESRKLQLTLTADRAGRLTNLLTARGEGNLRAEDRFDLEVIAPQLEVAVAGPKRRYLEREAAYQFSVSNPGSAPAKEIELVAYLPTGLKFVSANNSGHYEEASRTVHWRLEELPTGAMGSVELVTLPIEAGQQSIRLEGTAERGISADGEQVVLVEGLAAIKFQMVDVTDPIEVGGETTYEIRAVNQGSKAATNVRLAVLLPPEMRAVAGEGPARHVLNGNRVVFEGLPRLAPKADVTYRVRAQGLRPGDLRISAQLLTDEMQMPVTKEESTRVYSDE